MCFDDLIQACHSPPYRWAVSGLATGASDLPGSCQGSNNLFLERLRKIKFVGYAKPTYSSFFSSSGPLGIFSQVSLRDSPSKGNAGRVELSRGF